MDIFLSPGDSPVTITPGDTTLHLRVLSNADVTIHSAPPRALPVVAPATAERETVVRSPARWKRPTIIGLGFLAMVCIGLYSHMGETPIPVSHSLQPDAVLSTPPEFPSRPLPRQQTLPPQLPGAAPVQHTPSPLNQAFGLH